MIKSVDAKMSEVKTDAGLLAFERSTVLPLLALAVITVFGVALRFYKLGEWGFWIDEILEIRYAGQALENFFSHHRLSVWVIGMVLSRLGTSEWTARLAPALVGMLTIPILYFPVRKLFGSTVALIAILLLILSPWHLYWSQNARFYTFLILFYALGQLYLFFWLETGRPRDLVLAGLFLALAILERMISAFFVPVIAAYLAALVLLRFEKPKMFNLRNLLLVGGFGLLAGLVYIIATGFVSDFYNYIVGHRHSSVRVLLSIIYDIGLPLFIAAFVGAAYLLKQRSRIGLYLFVSAVVPVVLLIMIAPFTQTFSRYVVMTLPSWIILAAVAAKELYLQAHRHARILALGLLVIMVADAFSQDVLYYGFQNGNREDFKGAFAIVEQMRQPGDQVISTRPEIGGYYLNEEMGDSQELDLNEFVQNAGRTWFVVDNRTYVSPELQSWLDERTLLKGVRDVTIPGKTYGMRVYLYDPAYPASQ